MLASGDVSIPRSANSGAIFELDLTGKLS